MANSVLLLLTLAAAVTLLNAATLDRDRDGRAGGAKPGKIVEYSQSQDDKGSAFQ